LSSVRRLCKGETAKMITPKVDCNIMEQNGRMAQHFSRTVSWPGKMPRQEVRKSIKDGFGMLLARPVSGAHGYIKTSCSKAESQTYAHTYGNIFHKYHQLILRLCVELDLELLHMHVIYMYAYM